MRPGERPLSRDAAVVLGVVVLLALPHLLLGPQITADDWVWVRNGEFLGWWDAGGSRQVGRPGAFVLYALVFGLGGAHPLVHALVQVALWAAAAVAVLWALREVLTHRLALAIVLVWLVSPSHTTLELWASTSQAWVAVACVALGTRQVARAARGEAALWPSALLLGAAGAFYEVAILAAPVCAAIADRAITGRWRWQPATFAGLACAPALAWSMVSATVYTDEVLTTEDLWIEHLAGSLSMGLDLDNRAQAAAVLVVVLLLGALVVRRLVPTEPIDRAMVLGGGAVVLAGTIPALRSYTVPFGMGNRLLAISAIGATVLWFGIARPLVTRASRPVALATAALLAGAGIAVRIDHVGSWNQVGDGAVEAAADFAEELEASGRDLLVLEGERVVDGAFYGIYDGWNATAATQVVTGDPDLVVQIDIGCVRSGPAAEQPLEQYGRRAEARVAACARPR